ncbi:MAG: MFS transporter [Sporichthyaceae bacterium]
MSPTFASLKIPNYRRYASGMFVSNTGTWMQRVAQDWLVLQLSGGSAVAVGITTGLQFLPLLLFGLIGGAIADRYDKRRLLLITNSFLGLAAVTLSVLVLSDVAAVWHVYALAFALGLGTALDNPARQSFVVEMVDREHLPNAVALNSASFHGARLIGPGVAGLLIEVLGGTGWVFAINALTYTAPLIALRSMRVADLHQSQRSARGSGGIREGLRYVWGRPELVAILTVVFFAGAFGLNFQIFNAIMAVSEFDKGAGEFGLLGSVLAIGSLAGALSVARRKVVRVRLVMISAGLFGVTVVISGLMPSYLWYALSLPPAGIAALTMMTATNATLQMSVDPAMRGRVMAVYLTVFAGGTPIGSPLIGWMAAEWGPRYPMVIGGTITALSAAIAALVLLRRQDVRVRAYLRPRPHLRVIPQQPQTLAVDTVLETSTPGGPPVGR